MTVISDFFLHNWNAHATLETSYLTDISQSHDALTEERRGLLSRPRRVLGLHWTGIKQDETNRLLMEIMRGGVQQLLVPFYMDQSFTTAPSVGTAIACDTTNRHFVVGGQCLIFALDGYGRPTNPQVFLIDALGSGAITTHTAITGTYNTGALVFPLLLAEILLTGELTLVTDLKSDLSLSFIEVLSSGLPGSTSPGTPGPRGAQVSAANPGAAAATPILDVSPDYSGQLKIATNRAGARFTVGRDAVLDVQGARATLEFDFQLSFFNRPDAWSFLEFFDSCRGRLMPWWLVNPATLYQHVGQGNGYVDVAVSGQLVNVQDFLEYVAVVMQDGTVYVRKVTGIALVGGNWRISAPLPGLTFGNILRVTSAHFVRFTKDSMLLDYQTDGISTTTVEAVEILAETADTDATQTTASNCSGPGEDCLGPWSLCLIAYLMDPRAISFDCPPCLFAPTLHQLTVNPGDPCTQNFSVGLAFGDYHPDGSFHAEAGSCGGSNDTIPITLAETFGNYLLVYSGSGGGGRPLHVYANIARSIHAEPPCEYPGYQVPDDRHAVPGSTCLPYITIIDEWF